MNAIISLCHFCENHGPSIMFCTQVFHSEAPLKKDTSHSLDISIVDHPNTTATGNERRTGNVEAKRAGCSLDTAEKSSSTVAPEVKCEACRSLPVGLSSYVSTDTDADVTYLSSQHPRNQEVFSMVRQACVRSLSSEVSPGREGPGPIFFGDDTSGYVLSHTFIVKDSQYSRGFQRRYSIIIVMMDKIFLLNSWPFLVKHIRDIIEELQGKALKVYEVEQAKNPARSERLANRRHFPYKHAMAPLKPARSLVDLTGDKDIFRKIHQTFTWLLKAGGNRLTEKLLEGPPTEDSIIDVEKQEETEEGFVLLSSVKDDVTDVTDDGMSVTDPDDTHSDDGDCPVFTSLRHLLKTLGYSQFQQVAHHVIVGNQVIVRGRQKRLVRSIIDFLKMLLPKGCCKVIYHSTRHEDAWRCNFLGITMTTTLPHHIEHYVVITIHEPCPAVDTDVEDAVLSLREDNFSGYIFTVESPTKLPEKGPVVLEKMLYALMNDNLADSVVDQCLVCLKEECMNKVKVLFKFTKAGGSRSDDDTRELLNIVGAEPRDKVVLQFWRTGLSVQYRHHMLSSAINTST